MAEQLYFSRDSQMFLEIGSSVWKIPVLEGFSFSQATNTSEITLAEMESTAGVSTRGRRAFNDSLAPVDFSFSTYIRPFTSAGGGTSAGDADDTGKVHAVEEALWALFSGPAAYASFAFTNQTAHTSGGSTIDFSESNKSTLGPTAGANLYFEMGDANKRCYKLSKIAINEASIDFDIDGVAQINWSGNADTVTDVAQTYTLEEATVTDATVTLTSGSTDIVAADVDRRVAGTAAAPVLADSYVLSRTSATVFELSAADSIADTTVITLLGPRPTVWEGVKATNNFIRNRLTQVYMTVNTDPAEALEASYSMTLTGGNITLTNNITYLTPEELGVVNIPIGHVTGARSFGGSMTCYLLDDDTNANSSKDFFEDMTSSAQRGRVNNDISLTFMIGGGTAVDTLGDVAMQVQMDNCHVSIPTHSIEDIVTLETTFMALPDTIDATDECEIKYKGPVPDVTGL